MNRLLATLLALLTIGSVMIAQEIKTPAQNRSFSSPTSYDELSAYVNQLDKSSKILTAEVIGQTVQSRNLYALKFSTGEFGKDPSKIKVLILAQQHGNEQSGKEGALLIANELLKPENKYLFDRIDVAIVPQMNPDGSEVNQRRNGHEADLNRNHLILTEPETQALHRLFDQYLFEVTMDVHEYFPYGDTWKGYGYRNNSDILLGVTTNSNVSEKIRKMSNQSYVPFMKKYFDDRKISNFLYSPGGPPEIEYIRHSTFDINDGRQSFGIQNSFSIIEEGLNGTDGYSENLEHRAISQMTGMRGLLEYSYRNKTKVRNLVAEEREKLVYANPGDKIAIQSEHTGNGKKLKLPVYSYFSGNDSVIVVSDYRPVVRSLYDVIRPSGYLVPKQLVELTDWITRQALITEPYIFSKTDIIERYFISSIDSIDFEGDITVNPNVTSEVINPGILSDEYVFIPTSQLKGNLVILALEPKSILGLVTYKNFSHLLVSGEKFPILRVTKASKPKV
jgi:hypothetical protein